MLLPRFIGRIFVVLLTLLWVGVVRGQDYPIKPIRIIGAEPGGINDFLARIYAPELAALFGQPVIVENRPSTIIATETVSRAPPDGYLVLLGSKYWIRPLLEKMPYDAANEFSPVSLTNATANILVVHPSLPVTSVRELIALAKAQPGVLNYASGSTGAANHLAAELFKFMAGVNIVRVSYKGGGAILVALVSGEVPLSFVSPATVQPHLKAGRLKALAVTSMKPSELVPGLPTVSATVAGYDYRGMYGIVAPAKTPTTIINRLYKAIAQVVNRADVKEKVSRNAVETVGSSPEEFAAAIKYDTAILAKAIKSAGIGIQ